MDADVAVIGTGSIGSMALWRLARAGVDAIGFEQFGVGHDRSAAGGESRVFRTAYREGPEYVPTLLRSYELWRELMADSDLGADLLTMTGALMIGDPDTAEMRNVFASIERFDLPHQVLDASQTARRYPQHRLLPGESAVLDELGGVLRPEFAVVAAARLAERLGATVLAGVRVEAVEPAADGVVVRAGGRDHRVRQVVVTAGPWTGRFAPGLASCVTPRKLVMTWYPAIDPAAYLPERFPVFVRDSGDTHLFGIPTLDGGSVKVAGQVSSDLTDADRLDRNVPPADLAATNDAVARLMPGLVPQPVRVQAYVDAYTPDRHALVGALPGVENVWVLGAFSGHGFKMVPAMGQIAADLVTSGKTDLPVGHLDPARFAGW